MWLLHPQYWLFEAVFLFLAFLFIFRWFNRSQRGRRIARDLTLRDGTDQIVADADELRRRASMGIGEAEFEAKQAARRAKIVRQAADPREGTKDS